MEKSKILIIDDSDATQAFMKLVFPSDQYDLLEAKNGKQGLDILTSQPPDVILVDIHMPIMDGFEFLNHVPEIYKDKLEIIVLTTEPDEKTIRRCYGLGASNILRKPFSISEVQHIVQRSIERKKHLLSLQTSEDIISSINEFIAFVDKNYCYISVNDEYAKLFNEKPTNMAGQPISQFIGQETFEEKEKILLDRCFKGEHVSTDAVYTLLNKQVKYLNITYYPYWSRDNKINGSVILAKDITERKKMERQITESEAKYRALVENSADIIARLDKAMHCLYVSPAFSNIFPLKAAHVIGKKIGDWGADQQFTITLEETIASVFLCRESVHLTHQLTIKEQDSWLDIRLFPEEGEDTNVNSILLIIRDITIEKKMEEQNNLQQEQLLQADKLKTLGTLVSGVGHEINNPNSFIMLNTPILQDMWHSALPILKDYCRYHNLEKIGNFKLAVMERRIPLLLSGINEGALRIKNIVQNLKDFARQSSMQINDDVMINDVVATAIMLVQNKIKHTTDHFDVHYEENLPKLKGHFQKLEQVVINLIINALDALTSSSQAIRLSTSYNSTNQSVVIEVYDEGAGIDEAAIRQITNPFFTTKRDRGGTGLGLAISSGIVNEHKGKLCFRSTPGEGTVVTVELPVEKKL